MYSKTLANLEKGSISLKKSSKIIENLTKAYTSLKMYLKSLKIFQNSPQ
jgi:hypothetical protein